tara:strand:+ start:96 stop:1553 length:1458 start_codon:yes stop_codon:yes gene_type:complete
MYLKQIFDPALAQYAYLIGCQRTGEALIIDPERDVDRYLEIAAKEDLKITAVAETHIHADFVSGSRELLESQSGITAYLSDMGPEDWKYEWAKGRGDVRFVRDGDTFNVGNIEITVVHTPGHTPEHICFLIEDQGGGAKEPMGLVSGDFVFVGDVGRPDLLESAAGEQGAMEPSARTLYHSLKKFGALPEYLQVLPAHGAGSACGKALGAVPVSTVGYEKRFNAPLRTALNQDEDVFVKEILSGQPEPPMYFANMKKVNKLGPAVLSEIPKPRKLDPKEVAELAEQNRAVFLDTRTDQVAFMEDHLKGSLFTPMGDKLSTVAGSFVNPEQDIYLLVTEEDHVEPAVRELIRIGLDRIQGYARIDTVRDSAECRPYLTSTQAIRTSEINAVQQRYPEAVVLDVRRASEFAEHSVPGSVNIAYTRLAANRDQLPEAKLIVHCESGKRAAYASSYLERIGADLIFADGDYADWKRLHSVAEEQPAAAT